MIQSEEEEIQINANEILDMKAENIGEVIENILEAKIDEPKYEYDADFEEKKLFTKNRYEEMRGAIYPGKRVNIDAIENWVRTVKAFSDPLLQDVINTDLFDSYVDRVVHKVARKIYYVGRKPKSVTPEEWDDLTRDMRPAEGTYARGESWGKNVEFPYTREYTYRSGYYGDDA